MKDKDNANTRMSLRVFPCLSYIKFNEIKVKIFVKLTSFPA